MTMNRVGLFFELHAGCALYIHNLLCKDEAQSKQYRNITKRILAWLKKKRLKEWDEAFYVNLIFVSLR